MKIRVQGSALLIAATLALGACTTITQVPPPVVARPMPAKITATGHGSSGSYGQYNYGQQKLMSMRAAKLDAYRNLAEQVYGFQIAGSTTVSAFASQSDTVRAYIDSFMRGAKIVSVVALSDGIYEATVELDLSADFGNCVIHGSCAAPIAQVTPCVAPACAPVAPVCAGSGCAIPSGAEWNLAWPNN